MVWLNLTTLLFVKHNLADLHMNRREKLNQFIKNGKFWKGSQLKWFHYSKNMSSAICEMFNILQRSVIWLRIWLALSHFVIHPVNEKIKFSPECWIIYISMNPPFITNSLFTQIMILLLMQMWFSCSLD